MHRTSRLVRRLLTPATKPLSKSLSLSPLFAAPKLVSYRSISTVHEQREEVQQQTKNDASYPDVSQTFDDWFGKWTADLKNMQKTYKAFRGKRFDGFDGLSVHVLDLSPGGITIGVKILRQERGNALTSKMLSDLKHILDSVANHQTLNGICLLPSLGKTFCGGADTVEMSNLKGPDDAEAFIRKISDVCNSIRNIPVPVVALIQGPCIGAGLEIAASCDIRVCTQRASFSMPEVLVQLPSVVQARLLCDIVGWGRARHLMFTGSTWLAQEAFQAGLVTQVFSTRESMMAWAKEFMIQLNDPAGRNQYRAQKKLINGWENQTIDQGIEAGVKCFADHFSQPSLGKSITLAVAAAKQKRLATKEPQSPRVGTSPLLEGIDEY